MPLKRLVTFVSGDTAEGSPTDADRNRQRVDSSDGAEDVPEPGADSGDTETDGGVQTFPETTHSRVELAQKTGMTPEAYLHELLGERGKVKQQRFQTLSGLTSSSTSRLLSEIEAEGSITRYRIGGEKVIVRPDHSLVSSSERGVALAVALAVRLQSRLPGSVNRVLSKLISVTVNGFFVLSTKLAGFVWRVLGAIQRLWFRLPL
jgi:hypothetical protein